MPSLETNKKDITNIEKALFEIRTTLINNENIRKLLYFDTEDALEKAVAPRPEELINLKDGNDYITLMPVMEKGVIDYGKNTFIMIYPTILDLDTSENQGNIFAGISISIITDKQTYMLSNNRIRLFQLMNQVISLIDNKKYSAAGKLEVLSSNPIIYNIPIFGVEIKCMITDQGEGGRF